MSKNTSGISLIELMVVVAIVGILSSIAMPAYTKYVIKAKATELLTVANNYKIELIEQEISSVTPEINRPVKLNTKTIESVNISAKGENKQRQYIIEVLSKIASPHGNLSLQLLGTPAEGMISWECKVPEQFIEYMPSSCVALDA
jgi:prepilin-type N-terminal cleavage/methylation domain-containing protein